MTRLDVSKHAKICISQRDTAIHDIQMCLEYSVCMTETKSEKHASSIIKVLLRIIMNMGLVVFMRRVFPMFFVLVGDIKAVMLVGLILAFLNWIIVPILHILSLPIKFFAWLIGFLLVNAVALWITVWVVTKLQIEGISLAIGGGSIGWITLSFILGFCNWVVKAILK